MERKKIMAVFGTRPEAIKFAPVIIEAKKYPDELELKIVVTAQHRQMLDQVLKIFAIQPDYDLNIMIADQGLSYVTEQTLEKLQVLFEKENPEVVLVQGDTTTTFSAGLAAYYNKIKVGHIEAGLRTNDKYAPFPEEMMRRLTSAVTDYHFAPTRRAFENLLNEGHNKENIYLTGNTIVDALNYIIRRLESGPAPLPEIEQRLSDFSRLVLITGHRRESWGEKLSNICQGLRELAQGHRETLFVYPVHLNPNVRRTVYELLARLNNFLLLEPLDYLSFVWLMKKSHFIITDSGGIQEEAPSLGKPVILTREVTERPEAIESGGVVMVGTDSQKLVEQATLLLQDAEAYARHAHISNPFGDGRAAERIINILLEKDYEPFNSAET